MSYRRSLLQLVFVLLSVLEVLPATAAQIQGYPVDVIYLSRHAKGTNNLRAGLAHYWVGGSTFDSVGGATLTNNPLTDIRENLANPISGFDVALTRMDSLINNANICPQFSFVNYLTPTNSNDADMNGGPGVSFSFAAWVKPLTGTSGYGGCQTVVDILSKWDNSGGAGHLLGSWRLVRDSSGSGLSFQVFGATNNAIIETKITTGASPSTGNSNWIYIVVTYNDKLTNLTTYSNSVPFSSSGVPGVTNSAIEMEFFNSLGKTPGFEYVGNLADVAWWTNTVLSQNDINRLYNNGAGFPYNQLGIGWGRPVYINTGTATLLGTFPGNIYVTFDGTTPGATLSGVTSQLGGVSPPSGTYLYDAPMALPWNCTITARGTNGLFPYRLLQTNVVSFGENWSNNVVANGGASPSVNTVTNINLFGIGLNNDGIITNLVTCNIVATDSLIAASTPVIYTAGNKFWINHNFVAGDLSVNGLTGDGATKYFQTGLIPTNALDNRVGISVYAYSTNGTGGIDFGANNGVGITDALYSRFTDNHTYSDNGASRINLTINQGNGFYSANRTANTTHVLYFANSGTAWASIGSDATAVGATSTLEMYAWALNNVGGPANWVGHTLSYLSAHKGMTSALAQKEFNRVQALRTSFGGGFR